MMQTGSEDSHSDSDEPLRRARTRKASMANGSVVTGKIVMKIADGSS